MRAALPVVTAMLLVAIVVAFGHSLDLRISDQAFDFATTTWLVDHESGPLRLMLYDGPKRMLVLLGLFLTTAADALRWSKTNAGAAWLVLDHCG